MLLDDIGVKIDKILIPDESIDRTKWSVIACDQYTSEPEYWKNLRESIGDSPSTLDLIFPEVYLESGRDEKITKRIHKSMSEYLKKNIFIPRGPGIIMLDRKTPHTESRKGVVTALDLEKYDYTKGADTLIRASEGTILDRLPPRIKIRKDAPLELPHIVMLIDDPEEKVIEPLFERDYEKIYDFDLINRSGHISGYMVEDHESLKEFENGLKSLIDPEYFAQRYGEDAGSPMLFAAGDGNHSLATAKAIWEEMKKENNGINGIEDHPARFALVEIENIHDKGITFEPIHRVLFSAETDSVLSDMKEFFTDQEFILKETETMEEAEAIKAEEVQKGAHAVVYASAGRFGTLSVRDPKRQLQVGTLQDFLDNYTEKNKDSSLDYIHGKDSTLSLSRENGNTGFFLDAMPKDGFFKTVLKDGALPRKTFSMGESEEKRFYFESRLIKEV